MANQSTNATISIFLWFYTIHTDHVCEAKLVDKLFEDVLLALAPAHEGEEDAEDGDGEDGLVYCYFCHNRPDEQ